MRRIAEETRWVCTGCANEGPGYRPHTCPHCGKTPYIIEVAADDPRAAKQIADDFHAMIRDAANRT
jgi:rRNA maturation endonuclease Nob1